MIMRKSSFPSENCGISHSFGFERGLLAALAMFLANKKPNLWVFCAKNGKLIGEAVKIRNKTVLFDVKINCDLCHITQFNC